MCVSIISATNFIEKAKKQSIKVLPEIYWKFCRAENENILANALSVLRDAHMLSI